MSGTEHTRPMRGGTEDFPHKTWPRWRALEKRESAQFRLAHRQSKADLDMREQLRDLGSERDWYTLNTVGVHRPWPGAMALWECELLNHDTPGCCRDGSNVYATSTSAGYEVGFDPYFVERTRKPVIAPVIQDQPVVVTQSDYARKRARKHEAQLAARKRTLTDEQRKEILRRESVSMRGFSRI